MPSAADRASHGAAPTDLLAGFAGAAGVRDAAAALAAGGSFAVGGLAGGSPAMALAALEPHLPACVLVVLPGVEEAEVFLEDLALFLPGADAALFPAFDAADPAHRSIERGRVAARLAVLERPPRFIVAPLQAVLQPVPDARRLAASRSAIGVGDELDPAALALRLAESGFARVPVTEAPGEFSVRGGILDVFPRDRDLPVRVELFGDEVESLRTYDPESQRSVEQLDRVTFCLLGDLESTGLTGSADTKRARLIPHALPPGSVVVHVEEDAAAKWLGRFESSRPLEDLGTLYARFSVAILDFPNLRLSAGPLRPGPGAAGARVLTASGLARDLVTFRQALDAFLLANDRVVVLCGGAGEVRRIETLVREAGYGVEPRLCLEPGRLSRGFQVPELRTALLSVDEIFGRTRLPRAASRRRTAPATPTWTDLRLGDAVVHLDHGIGIYRGLTTLEKEGRQTEHLTVEFHGGTLVHVPVTRASLVHRYVGTKEGSPRLSQVGGKDWRSRKERVAASVEGVAQELLRVHALRAARPGIAYPPDPAEQLEFEATFPFDLTADQESALAAIKSDMERDTPTDRLLCGDVGFGKTELAVRAAFKAVMAGRQVAVLVPTTVLAEQHGVVFEERFAGYPILVEVLSRFRTGKEQREIIRRAAEGRVDVVIGTHRLVSKDVDFADLGLLVIDEEQRFGVRAKEALRHIRATVDVLTLTATPIPRTLHMALLGLRDISSLAIPPEGRQAIETRVVAPDDAQLRTALLREIERGGQAYFIHNRVQSIEGVASKIRHLVPEARVAVVHGQMNDHLVEQHMHAFVGHEVDVLVATTIVESGLDIPNANTIFIDRADRLGLADLHQLRGRVGRYHRRAYCYLIVPPGTLATDAERRVRAVEEHSDLGAGFRIAMRDLEIRGAGNLLGAEQSGHIAAVGYELYCDLLADAVRRVRQDEKPFRTTCHVGLPVPTAVPTSYVPDDRSRIQLHRRLSCASTADEVAAVLEDARDRFGRPPAAVEAVARLARVRICGEALGITRIARIVHDGEERALLRCVEPRRVARSLRELGDRIRVVDASHCHLLLPRQGLEGAELAEAVLFALSGADCAGR